jgi:hypothetical protein
MQPLQNSEIAESLMDALATGKTEIAPLAKLA